MDSAAAALAAAIGARVRAERQLRNLTLDDLADRAEVSRRMLVNVEQGAANPSVGTLLRLSDALGIALSVLVEPPRAGDLRVVRAGDGAALWTSAGGGQGVLVASTPPPVAVELWDWTLAPGDRHDSDAHSEGTRELLQVLKGSVEVTAGGGRLVLAPGDAASFRGDVPHGYACAGRGTARFTLAVHEPRPRHDAPATTPDVGPADHDTRTSRRKRG